jgi:flavin-dependent dehydrogenase
MKPVAVIGAGLAGSALALRLAAAGRRVLVFERERVPVHKVCGEFLSREACLYLAAAGVDLHGLGAVPIRTLRVCAGAEVATFPLPFTALSLSRRALDQALLERALARGAVVRRGAKVQALTRAANGWRIQLEGGECCEAADVFLATGKHDLRAQRRPPGLQNDLVAFKLHFRLTAPQTAALAQHVELVLYEGGYAGLEPVEQDTANLCLLIRRHQLRDLQGWPPLIAALRAQAPQLALRLEGAEPCWDRPLAVSMIPYGYVCRSAHGVWRLGDQAAVIPSFSGDGMSIALHSAELAASTYLAGEQPARYQRRLARDVAPQVMLATALSHALVRSVWQGRLLSVVRHWPRLVSSLVFHTRVSDAALARAACLGQP